MALTTAQGSAAYLNRALNNANATPTAFAATVADLTADEMAAADKFDVATLTDAQMSTQVLTNMGILPSTTAAVLALETELAAYFGGMGKGHRGFVVLQLARIVADKVGDATYGAAATAWNTEVAASLADSTDQTIALTTAKDTAVGGQGNDIFNALNAILSSTDTIGGTDVITGGTGNDTLNLSLATTWSGFTSGSMTGVEKIALSSTGVNAINFDGYGVTGATTITLDAAKTNVADNGAAAALTGINSGLTTLGLSNFAITNTSSAATVSSETVTLSYDSAAAEAASTSVADALTINLDKVGTSAYKTVTATINSIETLNVNSTNSNFVNFAGSDARTLNVAGSGAITIGSVPTSLRKFDASTATGVVTVDLTAGGATSGFPITSVSTGTGSDSVTIDAADLSASATIALGDGAADTLDFTASSTSGTTVEYTMTGVETLALTNVDYTTLFSGAKSSGLSTVTLTTTTAGGVSLVNMGSGNLEFTSAGTSGTEVSAASLTADHTGTASLTYLVGTAAAVKKQGADFTFSKATGALKITEKAYNTVSTNVVIDAKKATSIELTIDSGKDATGQTENTTNASSIVAPYATTMTITANGQLASGFDVQATRMTSATITNGTNAATVDLNTPLLNTLTISTGAAYTNTPTVALSGLQNLTIDQKAGAFTLGTSAALVKASQITLSGAGTTSSVDLNDLGATTNAYDLTVTSTGLYGGLDIGNVTLSNGASATFNLTGTTGNVTIGDINANASAANVTITAPGVGTSTGLVVGAISTSGNVVVNAKGASDAAIGTATSNTISGNNVTVDISGTTAASTTGDITAKTSAKVDLYALTANTLNVVAASGSTALTVEVNGGVLVDTLTVTSAQTTQTAITLKGDLGASADLVTVDAYDASTAKTINLSSLLNYDVSVIKGGTGSDTITGGAGDDQITPRGGTNVLTGGDGSDLFIFNRGDSTYSTANTITDFKAEDFIVYGGAAVDVVTSATSSATPSNPGSGVTGTYGTSVGYGGAVSISALGVATFTGTSTAFDSIYEKASMINQAFANGDGKAAFFTDTGSTYMFIGTGNTTPGSDIIIKLTGVSLPTTAPTEDTSGAVTGTVITDYSGLTGFGA